MITDLTTSSVALAVQQIAAEKKKIDIVVASSTSALTGAACTPYGFHWAYDTHALAVSTGGALVKAGGDTWFFITVDYAAGHAFEKDASEIVMASGGKVLGHVLYPLNTPDFSSFLLQAQSSKAKIVALANGGQDTINSIKQAAEFGIVAGGQRLAALLLTVAEVHGLGLQAAQGLVLTESYYWDLNDRTREFGERFFKRTGRMPNMVQAGVYSATLQYLKAVKAAGTKDADAVAKKLKELPVDDAFTSHGRVQANGRMVSDLYLFQVKKPSESKRDWDYYNLLATVPGDTAYLTAAEQRLPVDKVRDSVGIQGQVRSQPLRAHQHYLHAARVWTSAKEPDRLPFGAFLARRRRSSRRRRGTRVRGRRRADGSSQGGRRRAGTDSRRKQTLSMPRHRGEGRLVIVCFDIAKKLSASAASPTMASARSSPQARRP